MPENPLLGNIDRTVYTFNMHNIAEMCFNHVFKRKAVGPTGPALDEANKQRLDDCIQKYMQSIQIVQSAAKEELAAQ